jgi:acyl carrier protein
MGVRVAGVMGAETLEESIYAAIIRVAPEVDPRTLDPRIALRDQVEMDSVDFLGFVLDLERRLGLKVPELDYPRLASIAGCIAYLGSPEGERPVP